MVKQCQIPIKTERRSQWVDITHDIRRIILQSGIKNGICNVSSLHTTAGLTVNENADPDVGLDFFDKLSRMVPREAVFRHMEGNSDSHIKAALVGLSVPVPVTDGDLLLGTWQSVYFCEFDGPRKRSVSVTLIGE